MRPKLSCRQWRVLACWNRSSTDDKGVFAMVSKSMAPERFRAVLISSFAGAGLLLSLGATRVVTALGAALAPGWKATLADPMAALRAE
jgi:hypothetical protein